MLTQHNYFCFKCHSSVKANVAFTGQKKQSNKRFFSQLDDFDQEIVNSNAENVNVAFIEGPVDQEFTVNNTGTNLTTNENLVIVQTLESSFNERINREMGNIVDTVEDTIQNAILTAIGCKLTPKVALAVRSKKRPLYKIRP